MKPVLVSIALWAAATAYAGDVPDLAAERAERERISAERQHAQEVFAARERECRDRFAVTACLDAARRERRAALDRLRLQQDALDEADRKRRAAQRLEEIRSNVGAEEAKRREVEQRQRAKAEAASASEPEAPAAPAPRASSAAPAPRRAASAPDPGKVQAYEQRQAEAKAHREVVARRNAERAAKGKAAASALPTPGAASQAR